MQHFLPYVIPYVLLALSLIASLLLFLSLKRELHAQNQKNSQKIEELAGHFQATGKAVPEDARPAPRSGFNLNRRVQAMRMLRKGEAAAHVAAALGVPHEEVELLIRVERMAAQYSIAAPR